MKIAVKFPAPAFLGLALLCAALLPAAGCAAGKPARLAFSSDDSNRDFHQAFSQGYFTRTSDGGFDVVLTEDGMMPRAGRPNAPIAASATAPLRQTVHLRVLWRPLRGTRSDAPSATNSTIDWYIKTNSPSGRNDELHYRGAGFVQVYGGGAKIQFDLRSAHLELKESTGELHDPLGPSTVSGKIIATRNDALVNAILSDLDPADAQASTAANSHNGPPPRTPVGP